MVGDVHDGPIGVEPTIHAYAPFSHLVPELRDFTIANATIDLRVALLAAGDPATLAQPARRLVAAIDPSLPVTKMATMEQQVADTVAPQRFSMLVLAAFAGGALLLAAIGLYGVLAFAVAQRTREIGVRIALGASHGGVLRMVVRQGMTLVAVGLVVGLVLAFAVTRAMTSLLYRTEAFDPVTFAAVPPVLAAVALLACYLPARRASRVEPVVALRTE